MSFTLIFSFVDNHDYVNIEKITCSSMKNFKSWFGNCDRVDLFV